MKYRICISPGHGKSVNGGFDPGACSGNFREFDIAKEIAKYLSQYLRSAGFETELINYKGDIYLTDRIKKINSGGYDLAIELHLNAGGGTGSEVFYPNASAQGRRAASLISSSIARQFGIPDRGAKTKAGANGDYFAVVRLTKPLTLLVETLFIDTADVENVASASGRDLCARAISKAVIEYFGTPSPAPFKVKILCRELNVRSGPGTDFDVNMTVSRGGVFTITQTSGCWGRLRSGAGWINLGKNLVEMR